MRHCYFFDIFHLQIDLSEGERFLCLVTFCERRGIQNQHPNRMIKTLPKPRKFEFIGNHVDDSIVIGNYGDARFIAKGTFNLSGLIYCGKNTVEITLDGDGVVTFTGVCKKLLIRGIEGNCTLDLSNVTADLVWCESVKGTSVITLGPTKVIELISLDHEAVVRYPGKPLLMNYSLRGNSRIESWKSVA
jgi:hypothetical protein